jgi:hypothetical protein
MNNHDGLKTHGRMMICKITGHEFHKLHESFSPAKNKMIAIRVFVAKRHTYACNILVCNEL